MVATTRLNVDMSKFLIEYGAVLSSSSSGYKWCSSCAATKRLWKQLIKLLSGKERLAESDRRRMYSFVPYSQDNCGIIGSFLHFFPNFSTGLESALDIIALIGKQYLDTSIGTSITDRWALSFQCSPFYIKSCAPSNFPSFTWINYWLLTANIHSTQTRVLWSPFKFHVVLSLLSPACICRGYQRVCCISPRSQPLVRRRLQWVLILLFTNCLSDHLQPPQMTPLETGF